MTNLNSGNIKDYNKRHIGIDILKLVCAILVVLIHIPADYSSAVLPLTRCAVPCFFIISGYMLYDNGLSNIRIRKSIKKIINIWIVSTIIYLSFSILISSQSGKWSLLDSSTIVDFIVFNEHPFAFHLWYIDAYIYVLFFNLVFNTIGKGRLLPILVVVMLLVVDLVMGKYSVLFFNQTFEVKYTRNFLFVGIPYFTVGMLLKKYIKVEHLSNKWCTILVIVSLAMAYFEKYCVGHFIDVGLRDHYLSSSFLAISLFLYFLSLQVKNENIWSTLGRDYSLDIYILHPLIYWLVLIGISHCPAIGNYLFMNIAGPAIVIFLSIVTIYLKLHFCKKYENRYFNIS